MLEISIEQRIWPSLLTDRRDKPLTRTANRVFGLDAESFQLLPDHRLMVLFDTFSLPLDSQGDGTRTAIRGLMVLATLRGTVLLLEEPECHQHPGSLERYAEAVCRMARTQDVQVIATTHSQECVSAFLRGAALAESESAVFHLTMTDGVSKTPAGSTRRRLLRCKRPASMSAPWIFMPDAKRIIVLYEGDDDKAFFEKLQAARLLPDVYQLGSRDKAKHPGIDGLVSQLVPLLEIGAHSIVALDLDELDYAGRCQWFQDRLASALALRYPSVKLERAICEHPRIALFDTTSGTHRGRAVIVPVGLHNEAGLVA